MKKNAKEKFMEFLRKEVLKSVATDKEIQNKIYKAMQKGVKKAMRKNPELKITLRFLTKMLRQDQKEC